MSKCKFKVGDDVVFEHKLFNSGQPVKGVITEVEPTQFGKYFVMAKLENGVGRAAFTKDGRFTLSEEPSLRLASEIVPYKFKVGDDVIIETPDYNIGIPTHGTVSKIIPGLPYPIHVKIPGKQEEAIFTSDGRFLLHDYHIALSLTNKL